MRIRSGAAGLSVVVLATGCLATATPAPSPLPTDPPATPAPTSSATATPPATATPAPPTDVPLAVVTGLTNRKGATTLAEVASLASAGTLLEPCGIEVLQPALAAPASAGCVPADAIAERLMTDPDRIALLPPGLVEPATKTLPIDGEGPYGMFGADLFGDPAMRALPYPITGRVTGSPVLDPAWLAYDPPGVWTMSSVGGVCSDRGPAFQALELGKGWGWLFDGGTARYRGKPFLDPDPPEGISPHIIVAPVETGHAGTVAKLIRGADLTIADVECPIVDARDFVPNYGDSLFFSISGAVLPFWRDKLGIDVAYMAANHNTDKGLAGVKSTLRLLPTYDIEGTGLGLDIDQALEPAYVERGGVKIAFVAWNDVPGVRQATADSYGVPWLTKTNIIRSVRRAEAGGADVLICDPQWWGGAEYHSDLRNAQLTQLQWFKDIGCDDVVGAGTHLAGPMVLWPHEPVAAPGAREIGLVMASEGNLVFGQDWWQQTQEGVLMTVAFEGARLRNVHLYPYVMVFNARSDLTDPEGDGHYVLDRVWANSTLDYGGTP